MMSNDSRVSVIMIFLNAEKYVGEAIESVFNQTYENWELLLVDDGSVDTSSKIARQYADREPGHVRYLEHPCHQNKGMSASRNLGIRRSEGEYIAFLDADDVWLPNKLDQQVAVMQSQEKAAMIFGRYQYWYSWSGKPEDMQRDFVCELNTRMNALIDGATLLKLLVERKTFPGISGVLVRRQTIEGVGAFEESFWGPYEDQAFYAKVFLASPVYVSGECWHRYRRHFDSSYLQWGRQGIRYRSRITFLDWLIEYLTAKQIEDDEIWQATLRERWLYRHFARANSVLFPARIQSIWRWVKKWLLRIEKAVLPVTIQRKLWHRKDVESIKCPGGNSFAATSAQVRMNAQWRYRRWQVKKRYKRIVRTVCRAIYKDTGRDICDSIIVAGVARSGTTWLATAIASQFSCRIMFEPFYSEKVPEFGQFRDFLYMRPEEDRDELYSVCRKILSGAIRNRWIDVSVECIFPKSRLIKEVRANLFLRWIHERFREVPIVFIIRHPCAVVHSHMKLNWSPDREMNCLLRQPKLVTDFLSDKMDIVRNAKTLEAQHAIIWCVNNLVPIRQFSTGKLNVVFYEDLCTQPTEEISRIFAAINREYRNSLLKVLNQPSFMSRRASAVLKCEDRVLAWKQQLSSKQIANILSVVEAFELDDLYGDSATPRSDSALVQRLAAFANQR